MITNISDLAKFEDTVLELFPMPRNVGVRPAASNGPKQHHFTIGLTKDEWKRAQSPIFQQELATSLHDATGVVIEVGTSQLRELDIYVAAGMESDRAGEVARLAAAAFGYESKAI